MSNLIFKNNYPNIIVFTHNDMDGILSAMGIKYLYDNNLKNDAWDRNVTCYICSYGEKYKSLNWFKEKVNEAYIDGMQNIVYMTDYSIQPNNLMLNFWNWLSDKGCEFYWIDHHITAIENLKHLNIPGLQQTKHAGCLNTWQYINNIDEIDYSSEQFIPMVLRYGNDFDIWNKSSIYSWEKQLYPITYFINSLGMELNNNSGELVQTIYSMFEDNEYTDKCINIGKYIYRYIMNEHKLGSRKIYKVNWNDYNCLVVNSSWKGSTQFEQVEGWNTADILITWTYNGKTYQYGLYTTNPKIHVGELAQMYLNGGRTCFSCRR